MVRTPLAERIATNEFLNSVSLSLPHYDEAGVRSIIDQLQDPETGTPVSVQRESELAVYRRDPAKDDLFAALAGVPTYAVERPRRKADTARLVKLARMLTFDSIAPEAQSRARRYVVDRLLAERERLRQDPEWVSRVEGSAKVRVTEFIVEYGRWKEELRGTPRFIESTPENIFELFQRAGSVLGEGLHETYANRPEYREDISRARLELYCILQDSAALRALQDACAAEFDRLWHEHAGEIQQVREPRRRQYYDLRRRGLTPAAEPITVVAAIEIRRENPLWDNHLFVDDEGKFGWAARSWEQAVLQDAERKPGYAGFLRNMDRKPWALSIPYGDPALKPLFPDLLVFRRVKGRVMVDILDPHGDFLADALDKVKGLARYAERHGDSYGRIEAIRVVKDRIERLDLQVNKLREKVLEATTVQQLSTLYVEHG